MAAELYHRFTTVVGEGRKERVGEGAVSRL